MSEYLRSKTGTDELPWPEDTPPPRTFEMGSVPPLKLWRHSGERQLADLSYECQVSLKVIEPDDPVV
jgi:hypothetical protein